MEIAGKHVLITGGGSGIGRATAIMLAEHGAAHLSLLDVNQAGLAETADLVRAAGASASVTACDVADPASLTAAFAKAAGERPLDVVYNNAGVVSGAHLFPFAPAERVEQVYAININGVVIGTQLAVEHMAGRGGVVVNTVSTACTNTTFRDILYTSSKAAVAHFTKAAAQIHEPTGVRVCGVSPGLVMTPILDTTGGDKRADWMAPVLANNMAMPPLAIAETVVKLIEDDSAVGIIIDVVSEDWFAARETAEAVN